MKNCEIIFMFFLSFGMIIGYIIHIYYKKYEEKRRWKIWKRMTDLKYMGDYPMPKKLKDQK